MFSTVLQNAYAKLVFGNIKGGVVAEIFPLKSENIPNGVVVDDPAPGDRLRGNDPNCNISKLTMDENVAPLSFCVLQFIPSNVVPLSVKLVYITVTVTFEPASGAVTVQFKVAEPPNDNPELIIGSVLVPVHTAFEILKTKSVLANVFCHRVIDSLKYIVVKSIESDSRIQSPPQPVILLDARNSSAH